MPPKQNRNLQKLRTGLTQKSKIQRAGPMENSLLNRICNQYGYIQFITHDRQFILNEDGSLKGVEDIIIPSVPIHESIKGIAGLGENFTYIDRMRAADALDKNLTDTEQRALLHFLHKRTSEDKLIPIKLNAVKNQVAIALMRQIPANQEFPKHLVAMYYEKDDLDLTWRDYCIQFLGQCYSQIDTRENKQLVRETLFAALKDKKNIAAPAIIAIDGLSKYPGFIRSQIAEEAYKLVSDPETAYIVKIPALQIAARYKHPEAVNLARQLLTAPLHYGSIASSQPITAHRLPTTSPVILKMSAIATLGAHGTDSDIEILNKYRKSADIRLRTAAKAAIKKLM